MASRHAQPSHAAGGRPLRRPVQWLCALLLCAVAVATPRMVLAQSPEAEVEAVIRSLQTTWNSGDMDGYLARYRRDHTLRLTFGNTIVEGWDALADLFRRSYPDPQRMGRFTIDELYVQRPADDVAIAFGNFTHVFPHETVHGGFTHVLSRESDGSWKIRHERTSRGSVSGHE